MRLCVYVCAIVQQPGQNNAIFTIFVKFGSSKWGSSKSASRLRLSTTYKSPSSWSPYALSIWWHTALGVMLPYLSAGVVVSFEAGVVGVVGVGAPESEGKDASAAGMLRLFLHILLPFLSSGVVHLCLLCPSIFSISPKVCVTVWTCVSLQRCCSVDALLNSHFFLAQGSSCGPPPTQSVSSYPIESTTLALPI